MRKLIYASAFIFWTISFSQEMEKPNFLFIAIDDLRPELGLYGEKHIQSPNLDSLAKSSLVFNRSYCNVPVCGASRASLLTGTRPTRKRFLDYKTYKDKDYPEAISLPMLLKQNGYTTISNGKIYHHQFDDSLAWDQIWKSKIKTTIGMNSKKIGTNDVERGIPFQMSDLPDSLMTDGDLALKVISDLRTLKKESKPFFLTMGIVKPHLPFIAPKKYWDLYDRNQIQLPESYIRPESTPKKAYHNSGELRNYETIPKKGHLPDHLAKELIHGYYACVSFIDAQLGLVFEELEKLNLAKNTIVVIWGDHGWNLGDHMLWCKHCTFETSLRTPLLVKVPGITKGTYTNNITEFIDIYPSICDLAGIEKPKQLEGESFIPLMYGKSRKKNYAVSKFKSAVTLIKGDFFYTEWIDEETNIIDRMLFDHKTDPLELNNLAVKKENEELITKLSKELREKWGKDF